MPTESDFLHAIIAQPDDVPLRLVSAGWLVRGWFPFNPLAAKLGIDYDVVVTVAGPRERQRASSSFGGPGVEMRPRIVLRILAGLAGCVVLVCGGFYALWWAASAGSDRGSPALAAEWRAALLTAPGPDEAAASDPDVVVLRFPNGEWVFGKSQDSHGVWRRGGGTLVVRDSRGRVRAFFGHMCGPRYMRWAFGTDNPSLDAFYNCVLRDGKVEYTFPDAAGPGVAPDRPLER